MKLRKNKCLYRREQSLNKKAFTLIELLAVIVILAIISVIATPIILNVIRDTKEQSKKRSVEMYAKAIENAIAQYQIKENKNPITYKELKDYIKYEGKEINCSVKIYNDITFSLGNCEVDNQSIAYSYGKYIDKTGIGINIPNGFIPVIYKNGNWEIADTNKKWYDYYNQEWANAVILNEGVSKEPGTKIYPSGDNINIKAMFVYIPRYSYTIGNTYGVQLESGSKPGGTTPGAIDIKFVDINIKENGVANYTGNTPSEWYTHPAFTFGAQELEGIWVGKFELGHTTLPSSDKNNNLNCTNNDCDANVVNNLRILPNIKSLRYNNVSNFFYGIRAMSRNKNTFGIVNVDTHMIKNSEWGAVAYLSQSKYGKYGNKDYTGENKEVYQNKSKSYITGNSNGRPSYGIYSSSQCTYDDITNNCGVGASTTGNITGIYDMSGGAAEYVMGYLLTANPIWGATSDDNYAGFSSEIQKKYYDGYIEKGSGDKGHALSELGRGWYWDVLEFPKASKPWILRGLIYDNDPLAGIFSSSVYDGSGIISGATRVVLVNDKSN